MPAAIHFTLPAVTPRASSRHQCVMPACTISLPGAVPACRSHREQLPAAELTALTRAWGGGDGKDSLAFTAALEAAQAAVEARRAGRP